MKAIRCEPAGRQLSFLHNGGDGSGDGSGGGDSGGDSDGGSDSGGDGSVAILHTNITALFLNPFTVKRTLFFAPRGCFARFRLIMTVSTHRSLNLPVPPVLLRARSSRMRKRIASRCTATAGYHFV